MHCVQIERDRPSPQPSPSSPCGGLRGGDKSVLLPLALPQGRGGGSTIQMDKAPPLGGNCGIGAIGEQSDGGSGGEVKGTIERLKDEKYT